MSDAVSAATNSGATALSPDQRDGDFVSFFFGYNY